MIAIAAFAGPAAGAAGRSQENLVLRPLLRRSPPGLVLDKGPRGGPGGSRAAFEPGTQGVSESKSPNLLASKYLFSYTISYTGTPPIHPLRVKK